MGPKAALQFQLGKVRLGPLRTYHLCAAAALVIGLAGPSHADDIEPEPSSDAPVVEKAPTKDQPAPQQTLAEQFKKVWNRDLFTGDWEGWRTTLQEHGIDPQFRLSHYGQWVADGGVETEGSYAGITQTTTP